MFIVHRLHSIIYFRSSLHTMPTRYLAHHTWREIQALEKTDGVVILPIGAVEQHGHHLPVITDTLLVTHIIDATLRQLPEMVQAWVLPPINYGKSNEHAAFPGTITLSAQTLSAILHEIAESVQRAGFRRLLLLNGHGGNVAVLDATARDIRAATGLMCFCLQPALLVDAPFTTTPEERCFGIHAGELETSMVLSIHPELVKMEQAVRHFPEFPQSNTSLFLFGSASVAWLTQDWSPTGVFGDATIGTAEKGQMLIAAAVDRLVALITQISTFEIHNAMFDA